jgi:RNA polymerase sigma-70 factor (ECF subfamily)
MAGPAGNLREPAGDPGRFATTQWSDVLAAAGTESPGSHAALGALYTAYSHPLYLFVRQRGHNEHDAQDLLHDFFHALIEKNYLKSAMRERGRFRAFLLGSLKHFLANEWHRAHRAKRGGHSALLSLDQLLDDAERRFQVAAVEGLPPDAVFDREWAHALLSRAVQTLRRKWDAEGRPQQFAGLRAFLTRPGDSESYREAGAGLGLSEGAVKVAVHRLRQGFQAELRREIAATVGPAGEVEDELRHLVDVLRHKS